MSLTQEERDNYMYGELLQDKKPTRVKDPDNGGACECGGNYWWRKFCGAYVCDKCGSHKDLANCFCGWHKGQGESPEGEDSDRFGDEPIDEDGFYRD